LAAIKKLRSKAVFVYLPTGDKEKWKTMPEVVKTALQSPEAGKTIPIIAITDAESTKLIYLIPHGSEKELKKHYREAKKKIREAVGK